MEATERDLKRAKEEKERREEEVRKKRRKMEEEAQSERFKKGEADRKLMRKTVGKQMAKEKREEMRRVTECKKDEARQEKRGAM